MKTIKTIYGDIALPCMEPRIVPIDQVQANDYNPNEVSKDNMLLLLQSIRDNGFCFAVVTIWDEDSQKYIIIDGFHRYDIFLNYLKASEIPIVVLDHDMAQRMAATVQFNRARGVHQTELMGDLVQALLKQGASDEDISKHLGMKMEEVYRLKQITGFADLFKNQPYSMAWEMRNVGNG